jgi:beta-1,4-N-acetylglucosaminyltransferase
MIAQKVVEKILELKKKTIFVTVGNGKFDPLVKELDRLKEQGIIKEEVTIQIGHGTYQPKHCKWFTFSPSLQEHYKKANLIIGHGGPGTVFEILRLKKKLITLPNRDRTDPNHQVEYLKAMAKETSALIYCDTVELLEECINKSKTHQFGLYNPPECNMHGKVKKFLDKI